MSFQDKCNSLSGQAIGAGFVESVAVVSADADRPETCQVLGRIDSSPSSTIRFQLDLPQDTVWNQKIIQIGGGGYNGVVRTADLIELYNGKNVRRKGYAFVGADGGVQTQDLSQTLNNPAAFANFAYAYHPRVLAVAKEALKRMYEAPLTRSYFYGGSTGGREALLQAQRYPENYDGIIAAEPVVDYGSVTQKGIALTQLAFANGGAGWISPVKASLLESAQLAACDALDGLNDGIISNVAACNFDLQTLRCPGGADTGNACLSDAQIASAEFMRSDYQLPVALANGVSVAPPWGIGAEGDSAGGITGALFGATSAQPTSRLFFFSDFWLKYVVTSDTSASALTYPLGSNAVQWQVASNAVNATNPDLNGFDARGGKLLLRVGLSDHLVPPGFAINYYNNVVSLLGQAHTDSFMRFYTVPGSAHGVTGPGAGVVDLLSALEDWVERGLAPGQQRGVRADANGQTLYARPVCRYPQWPQYQAGDVNAAESFACTQ